MERKMEKEEANKEEPRFFSSASTSIRSRLAIFSLCLLSLFSSLNSSFSRKTSHSSFEFTGSTSERERRRGEARRSERGTAVLYVLDLLSFEKELFLLGVELELQLVELPLALVDADPLSLLLDGLFHNVIAWPP